MRQVGQTSGSSAALACPGSQRTSRGAITRGHKGNHKGVAHRTIIARVLSPSADCFRLTVLGFAKQKKEKERSNSDEIRKTIKM